MTVQQSNKKDKLQLLTLLCNFDVITKTQWRDYN